MCRREREGGREGGKGREVVKREAREGVERTGEERAEEG